MTLLKKLSGRLRRFFRSLRDLCRFLGERPADEKTVVLIGHSADSTGGASVVLFELARLIRQRGYRVLFLSYAPGALLEACETSGISGFLTDGFHSVYLRRLAKQAPRCFLVNTAVCHKSVRLLQRLESRAPVFWWLHEETVLLEAYQDAFSRVQSHGLRVLCVSQRVKDTLRRLCPPLGEAAVLLPYGCRDLYRQQPKQPGEPFVILSVGRLCARKNQLQLVDAVEGLPAEIRSRIRVQFVFGSGEPAYEARLRAAIRGKDGYLMTGLVSRERIPALYAAGDLLVCTSLDDPLPVVVTEAMMLHCPAVTSSGTGHYPLIRDGENGYRYEVRDTEQLRSRILEAYHRRYAPTVTAAARSCYERHFSLPVLEHSFFALLEETL